MRRVVNEITSIDVDEFNEAVFFEIDNETSYAISLGRLKEVIGFYLGTSWLFELESNKEEEAPDD